MKAIAAANNDSIANIVMPIGLCLGSKLVVGVGAGLAGGVGGAVPVVGVSLSFVMILPPRLR